MDLLSFTLFMYFYSTADGKYLDFFCLFSIYRVGGNGQNTSRKFLRFVLRNILKFVNCNDNTKSNHNKL